MGRTEQFVIRDIFEADDESLFEYQVKPELKERIKKNIKNMVRSKAKLMAASSRAQESKDRARQDIISRFKFRV